jgi:hypothetical protein
MRYTKEPIKKGQAALEFLVNYGWVILVLMVVFASLVYFGVMEPASAEYCIFPPGIDCIGKASVNETGVVFVLINNNMGSSLNIIGVSSNDFNINQYGFGAGRANITREVNNSIYVQDGGIFTVYIKGDMPEKNEKFRADIKLYYINTDSGLNSVTEGTVLGRV